MTDNAWHHVAATYNGSERKLFLNGHLVKQGAFSEMIPYGAGTKIYIGADYPGGDDFFKGKIDDIYIYSRSLTCSEIDSLYDQHCITDLLVQDQVFTTDTIFYARHQIELDNVSVNPPFELTLKTPEILVSNYCEVKKGAKMTVVNKDGCLNN